MAHNRYHNPLDPWYVDEDVAGESRARSKAFGEAARRSSARLRGGSAGAQSVEALERNIASRALAKGRETGVLTAGAAAGGQVRDLASRSGREMSEEELQREQARDLDLARPLLEDLASGSPSTAAANFRRPWTAAERRAVAEEGRRVAAAKRDEKIRRQRRPYFDPNNTVWDDRYLPIPGDGSNE